MVRSSFPRIAGVREAWVLLGEAENILAHLGPSREKNRASFTQVHLCSQHSCVDHFCDKMGNEPEEAQVGQCAPPPTLPSVREVGWVHSHGDDEGHSSAPSPYTGQTHSCVAGECTGRRYGGPGMLRAASGPQGNEGGAGCQSMVPRLSVSYWGNWAEMRTSWALGFRVKVREGGGILNRGFFPTDGGSPSRD